MQWLKTYKKGLFGWAASVRRATRISRCCSR